MDFDRDELNAWADSHLTSLPLAQAILEEATDLEDADEIWMADTDDETIARVKERAWQLCDYDDPDCKQLHWGVETLNRD